ncbi:TetR/AcrR family transcriptional regulator [Nocardiopsis gilva YIM 90087]|uniref:TetR/AcrR family transcriptional regulator n=1 Tax=Nocardiopsis gilva YIM 90087 TaxID=1235441 RepID=A0A223S774_9ACTN|nr:TetR/AcrR family transcriptional regulator [Nocardiopsis gilva]ASU83956.1 TetR/AcrR family transcriptional regulator [Nocardiopsis gilva YIM 90087]
MVAEKLPETRRRILESAAELLAEGGADAVSTRAVSAAAGVQAPTLYRLFGDKQGLLDELAAYGFERYLAEKEALGTTDDPVADLRRGWDRHVEFGVANPAFYVLMYGTIRPGRPAAAAEHARDLLGSLLERIARAGRLSVPVDTAARMVHAASSGVTLSLISAPEGERDPDLSPRTRETIIGAISTAGPEARDVGDQDAGAAVSVGTTALTLDALLDEQPAALTPTETALLRDWLRRLAGYRAENDR